MELGPGELLEPLYPKNNTFPGEVLLELAAAERSGQTVSGYLRTDRGPLSPLWLFRRGCPLVG